MEKITWWLVRHAKVTHMQGKIYGGLDPSANTTIDVERYHVLQNMLPQKAYVICSTQKRTWETFDAVKKTGWNNHIDVKEKRFLRARFWGLEWKNTR